MEGQMEPVIQSESIKIFLPHHCWSNIGKKKEHKICGMNAGYYSVTRYDAGRPSPSPAFMWLCDKHKKTVERAGYTCTPVRV